MLVDTDVMTDILRNHPPAIAWLQSIQTKSLGISGFVSMELLQGCRNRVEQQRVLQMIGKLVVYWHSENDCNHAISDFAKFYLSDNLGIIDSLIAHTAIGLGWPLATFNVKHYRVIQSLTTMQPYTR